ncbi:MAG: cAMP-binding protein [Collinsella sp.]
MDKERLEPDSPQEEAMWRAQVLRRTARICSAKAKELERMAKVDGSAPMRDGGTLKDVLKRIDNVMEWRFVDALGEVVLDGDILAESIDCEALRTIRYCVAEYLKRIEEREAEGKSDE